MENFDIKEYSDIEKRLIASLKKNSSKVNPNLLNHPAFVSVFAKACREMSSFVYSVLKVNERDFAPIDFKIDNYGYLHLNLVSGVKTDFLYPNEKSKQEIFFDIYLDGKNLQLFKFQGGCYSNDKKKTSEIDSHFTLGSYDDNGMIMSESYYCDRRPLDYSQFNSSTIESVSYLSNYPQITEEGMFDLPYFHYNGYMSNKYRIHEFPGVVYENIQKNCGVNSLGNSDFRIWCANGQYPFDVLVNPASAVKVEDNGFFRVGNQYLLSDDVESLYTDLFNQDLERNIIDARRNKDYDMAALLERFKKLITQFKTK